MTWEDTKSLLPLLGPFFAALAILVVGGRKERGPNPLLPLLALAGFGATLIGVGCLWPLEGAHDAFAGGLRLDGLGLVVALLVSLGGAACTLLSVEYLKRRGRNLPEFYVLVLFSAVGMMVMGMSTNWLTLLLGLETMSLALYILCGFLRSESRSVESSIKYFLTGSFATGLFLFGMGLIYGGTGSFEFRDLGGAMLDAQSQPLIVVGVGFLLGGFLFKIGAAPLHMWLPDVYEGAPTPITGFMATGVKVAAFASVIRVLSEIYQHEHVGLRDVLWWIALITMIVGNVAALAQTSVKRMLAYSSIAHAGYLTIALVVMRGAAGENGVIDFSGSLAARAVLYYLLAYLVANMGAFGVLSYLEKQQGQGLAYDDLAGLGFKHRFLGLVLSVFALSLAGIPGTAGFVGKFLVFGSAVDAGVGSGDSSFVLLAILGILNSLVGLYYYLRVLIQLYAKPPSEDAPSTGTPLVGMGTGLVIVASFIGTLWWGFGADFLNLGFGVEPAMRMMQGALATLR